jgi:4-hydroxy-tetrahydrodipicolinate synthase
VSDRPLRGVIAAAATPIAANLEPDLDRFVRLCRWLLDEGCDGLNVCGTTGEATSLSTAQRMAVMSAAAGRLPRARLMVGTGAAAVADAVALTRHAA